MGKRKKRLNKIILYIVIAAVGVVMVYPVIWMFLAAFKTNSEIFGSLKLLPGSWSPDAFIKGWQGTGK